MGLKKILEQFKDSATKSKEDGEDPKERNRKRAKTAQRLADMATKGLKAYKKGEEITSDAKGKVIELTEKAMPIADTIDRKTNEFADAAKEKAGELAGKAGEVASDVGEKISGTAKDVSDTVSKKLEERRKEQEKLPSSGSSLVDLLSPGIPDTEATKSKEKRDAEKAAANKKKSSGTPKP